MFGSLKKLEERLAKLERKVDDRDLDWVDMRARCKRLLDRTEKAARLTERDTTTEEPVKEPATNGTPHGLFTDHQRKIQQEILRRRGGM